MALQKIIAYQYNKRNLNLTTPCCSKAIAMASLPLLLAYQINTAIVIPVAKSASYSFLRTKTEMNLYGMIFKVYEPNTSTLQSYCSPVAEQQNTLQRI
jgi:hypothetical protein